jgi:gliding motility-associated-like protein
MKVKALIILILSLCFSTAYCIKDFQNQSNGGCGSGYLHLTSYFQTDSLSIDSLKVPNFFSPNGDMVNDRFLVKTDGARVYEFRIYTRSGTQVFFSESPQIQWDGRNANGIEVPEGIYYYVIQPSGNSSGGGRCGFLFLYR